MLKVIRAGKLSDGTTAMGCIVVADDRLVRRAGDYERFVDAMTYEEGHVYADARGFKDLYSEDVESMGLMDAVISRMEVEDAPLRGPPCGRARAADRACGLSRPVPAHSPATAAPVSRLTACPTRKISPGTAFSPAPTMRPSAEGSARHLTLATSCTAHHL